MKKMLVQSKAAFSAIIPSLSNLVEEYFTKLKHSADKRLYSGN